MYPTRTAGYVSSWDGDQLKLSSQPHTIGTCLNPSAALVWLLCDGNRQLAELIACLSAQFGTSAPTLVADIRQLLVDLTARGLIIVADQPQPLRPFIKIAFAGFGAVFPHSDNFFTWMLSHQFDVLVVDVEYEPPDVLFYREPSRDPY